MLNYIWIGKRSINLKTGELNSYAGRRCRIIRWSRGRKALIEFEDGHKKVVVGSLRRVKTL